MSCIKAEAVKQIGKRDPRKPASLRYRSNNNPWSTFVILAGSGEKRERKKKDTPAVASRYDHSMFVLANALYVSELRAIFSFIQNGLVFYYTASSTLRDGKPVQESACTRTRALAGDNGDDVDAL